MAVSMIRWRWAPPLPLRDLRHLWGRMPMRVLKRRARREVRFRILEMTVLRGEEAAVRWAQLEAADSE